MNLTWISSLYNKGKSMFSGLWNKIKNFGVGKAIEALDNIEKPLGDKIEEKKKMLQLLDSQGLAKWIVDEVQFWLRSYFKVPQPPSQ